MSMLLRNFRRLKEYPSAVAGLIIIAGLIVLSIYTVIAIPYSEAVRLWRGGGDVWEDSPKNAWPAWTNWLSRKDRPHTIVLTSESEGVTTTRSVSGEIVEEITDFTFDFPFDEFPPEMTLFFKTQYESRPPHVSLTWFTPDGREIRAGQVTPSRSSSFRFGQEANLTRRLGGVPAEQGLFMDPEAEEPTPLKGTYRLRLETLMFEPDATVSPKLVLYGAVHGIAGTDHLRRDLMIALLWGTPVAMSFGLIAAAGTSITTMTIAAFGVWYGGAVDSTIQRINEVVLIIPLLPILIMIGTFYSRSIWVMLGVVVLLSIFGAAIKSYRAIFLQVSTLPYVEAARAYGASNTRIVMRYLVPRVLPLVIPNLVILVPAFVFLEASLAVLGLGDPVLPTWGKVIQNANVQGALYNGYYYWILQPAFLLMIAGLAFAMVGFALDRVFNPRLREL